MSTSEFQAEEDETVIRMSGGKKKPGRKQNIVMLYFRICKPGAISTLLYIHELSPVPAQLLTS
jgi:hypothetical protein